MPNDESSEARAGWVVVVPVKDAPLFHYLTKSFAAVPDVSVVLERRRGRAVSETAAHEGRREDRRAQARLVSNFGCAVIRRPSPAVPQAPAAARGRTLLWPHLRITDILPRTEQRADSPRVNDRES